MARCALLAALLLGCSLSSVFSRFLVLQQDETQKFPGLEGHTYYVVNEEVGHSPETVATIKTWQANDIVPLEGAWNGGLTFVRNPFTWIFQQLEAVEALQRAALSGLLTASQQTSMSADEEPSYMDEQEATAEDMLRHVGCSRFKQAMQQYANMQAEVESEDAEAGDFSSRNYASEQTLMGTADQVEPMFGRSQSVDKEAYNYYGYYQDDETSDLEDFYDDYYGIPLEAVLMGDDSDQLADLSDAAASKLMQLLEDAYSLSYEEDPLEPVTFFDRSRDMAYGDASQYEYDGDYLSESGFDAAASLADAVLAELESEYFGYDDDDTGSYFEDDSYYGYYGDDEYWDEVEDSDAYYEPQVLDVTDNILSDPYIVVSPGSAFADSWVELPFLLMQSDVNQLGDYEDVKESAYPADEFNAWQLVDVSGNLNWSLLTLFLLVPATLGMVIGFTVSFLQLRGQMRRQQVYIPVLVERTGNKGEEQYTFVAPLLSQHLYGGKQMEYSDKEVEVEVAADHVDPKAQGTDAAKALMK